MSNWQRWLSPSDTGGVVGAVVRQALQQALQLIVGSWRRRRHRGTLHPIDVNTKAGGGFKLVAVVVAMAVFQYIHIVLNVFMRFGPI